MHIGKRGNWNWRIPPVSRLSSCQPLSTNIRLSTNNEVGGGGKISKTTPLPPPHVIVPPPFDLYVSRGEFRIEVDDIFFFFLFSTSLLDSFLRFSRSKKWGRRERSRPRYRESLKLFAENSRLLKLAPINRPTCFLGESWPGWGRGRRFGSEFKRPALIRRIRFVGIERVVPCWKVSKEGWEGGGRGWDTFV